MHVVVGPVLSQSAIAYADFADEVLATSGSDLPTDVMTGFTGYLAEWRRLAQLGTHLTWETEVDPEVVEYLVLAFYRLTQQTDSRSGTESGRPAAAEPFYNALVEGLLAAMAEEGAGSAEFSEQLGSFWRRET